MAKGKFKHKPTGERTFSSPEEIAAGTSADRPRTFKKQGENDVYDRRGEPEQEEESEDFAKPIGKTTDMSRREREELEKQQSHEHYMKRQEQGKTEQARKDLERLTLIRQQRAEAAKKREEEKAAKEERKAEARK
ncbi:hypothetical protein GQ55_3G202900 [Panicum hallii var. hallii]|uniref:Casein kinase substrate phosphoprotein PP28 domain-containing protein n=1 Tax=Panicum hallii var. hallii TaxID=1504633 RepID=A0A2T7EBH6_9POAL|nr:hypothetical protein GQ55_3G202900 [Panicum hallii var. hallii]